MSKRAEGLNGNNWNTGNDSPYGPPGGSGRVSTITGAAVMYASGGQGYWSNTVSANATANTGNGGGGSRTQNSASSGWNGGTGVAIVRNGRAAASFTGSPTITMAGSDFVYTFTGNGSITF